MIKNSKRKIIENNEIRLHYLSGALNMLEKSNPNILKGYEEKAKNETIDTICKNLNIKLSNKNIKTLKQGSFRPENDEEYLIYEYYTMQESIWNNKDFDNNLLDKKSYDYNEIIETKNNYYEIFPKKNKIESSAINQICESAKKKYKENDNTKNISDLCDYIIKLEKVFKDKDLINILIKKQMFNMGFTIGRYISLEDIKIFDNKYNYTTTEIRNNIINIYIANYEKLFSFIDFEEERNNNKNKKEPKAENTINKLLKNNKNTYFSKQDIQNQTSLSEATIKRYLIKQQKNKIIKKIGAKKNSKYIFIGG